MTDIRLEQIQPVDAAQMRVAGTDPSIVAEYAEAMTAGAVFPPIIIFHDGETYWPADGFHRIEAARRINRKTIAAEVREGGQREAILFACSANANHGLRRTQADKRKAVETLLRDPEWAKWSAREIGKACAVDHKTVSTIRKKILDGEFPIDRTVKYQDRHGGVSERRVIGKASPRPTVERILETVPTEALIVECRRRGLEVQSDA